MLTRGDEPARPVDLPPVRDGLARRTGTSLCLSPSKDRPTSRERTAGFPFIDASAILGDGAAARLRHQPQLARRGPALHRAAPTCPIAALVRAEIAHRPGAEGREQLRAARCRRREAVRRSLRPLGPGAPQPPAAVGRGPDPGGGMMPRNTTTDRRTAAPAPRGSRPAAAVVATLARLHPLERVPRAGWLLRGVNEPESVAAHSHAVALLARLVCDAWPGSFDAERAMGIALVHDCAEVATMDIPMPAGDDAFRAAKSRNRAGGRRVALRRAARALRGAVRGVRAGRDPRGAPRARAGQGADDDPGSLLPAGRQGVPRGLLAQPEELPGLRPRAGARSVRRGRPLRGTPGTEPSNASYPASPRSYIAVK